ncbi:hypothetical protein D3C76_1833940 [compost metagenome]
MSGALADQALGLGEPLERTDIDPMALMVLTADLALRHRRTQQRRKLERARLATGEQRWVQ